MGYPLQPPQPPQTTTYSQHFLLWKSGIDYEPSVSNVIQVHSETRKPVTCSNQYVHVTLTMCVAGMRMGKGGGEPGNKATPSKIAVDVCGMVNLILC